MEKRRLKGGGQGPPVRVWGIHSKTEWWHPSAFREAMDHSSGLAFLVVSHQKFLSSLRNLNPGSLLLHQNRAMWE